VTGRGHRAFGMAFAATAAVPFLQFSDPVTTGIMAAAAWPGSTAPDWLEIRYGRKTVLRHRGITHILLLWLALFILSLSLLLGFFEEPFLFAGAILFGFSLGGISHWIGDVGTPMGVPVWHPRRRVTLRMWRAKTEVVPIIIAWASVAFILTLTIRDSLNLS